MSTNKKPPNDVEKSAAPAVAETKPAAAPKAAKKSPARAKKTSVKTAAASFASRRVWPD